MSGISIPAHRLVRMAKLLAQAQARCAWDGPAADHPTFALLAEASAILDTWVIERLPAVEVEVTQQEAA